MRYKPGGPLNLWGGKKPPKYFEPKKTAEKFPADRNSDVFKGLFLNQRRKIKELVELRGLKLDRTKRPGKSGVSRGLNDSLGFNI